MKTTLALLVLITGLAAAEPIAAVECRLEPAPDAAARASRGLPHLVIPRMPKAPVIDGQWTAEEWQGAEATEAFVVPVTGTNADPDAGHGIWDTVYTTDEFYAWLLQQVRQQPAQPQGIEKK